MNEVYEFLKACGTYYLATVDKDGAPRVRPFGTVDCWNGKLTLQTGLKKDVAKQMLAEPRVEICAVAADGRWLRLSAKAVLVEDVAAAEHMLEAYPSLRAMYTPGDGNTAVFALTDAAAVICSFTAPPVEYRF